MIAGFMSGMAGNVSAFATVWVYDVYKPLFNKNASDHHYLNMGRLCSLVGVCISIGTAYLLFYFSNVLEFFQALGLFFLVPLFAVVILGMMWKHCSPTGAFWGFAVGIAASIAMYLFVHTFPEGHRPDPQVALGPGTVVSLVEEAVHGEKDNQGEEIKDLKRISRVIVEKGKVRLINVPFTYAGGKQPFTSGDMTVRNRAVELPTSFLDAETQRLESLHSDAQTERKRLESLHPDAKTEAHGGEPMVKVKVLAPETVLAASQEPAQFGVEGVPVILQPGVEVSSQDVTKYVDLSSFNQHHDSFVARSWKANPIGVYMYCALWSFLLSVFLAVGLSYVTPRRAEADLKDLVMGLTKVPDQGPCVWYKKPVLWAAVILITLTALNIIFW